MLVYLHISVPPLLTVVAGAWLKMGAKEWTAQYRADGGKSSTAERVDVGTQAGKDEGEIKLPGHERVDVGIQIDREQTHSFWSAGTHVNRELTDNLWSSDSWWHPKGWLSCTNSWSWGRASRTTKTTTTNGMTLTRVRTTRKISGPTECGSHRVDQRGPGRDVPATGRCEKSLETTPSRAWSWE
eukprot:4128351-Pyramimonas_sp.AAC.1